MSFANRWIRWSVFVATRYVAWPKMRDYVSNMIASCPCRRVQPMLGRKIGAIRGILERPKPNELLSIDFWGPRNWNGRTSEAAIAGLAQYVSIFGVPQCVINDNGTAFTTAEYRNYVADNLRARVMYTSPYYPQGNGINESSHQALGTMIASEALSAMVSGQAHASDTDEFRAVIRRVTMAYNATPHSAVAASPHFLMFGTELALPGWQRLVDRPSQQEKIANGCTTTTPGCFQRIRNSTEKLIVGSVGLDL